MLRPGPFIHFIHIHIHTDWYWDPTLDKYGVIDVSSLFSSVSPALDSIKACVNAYIDFLGDSYTLTSYEVNPWNYCGYRTIGR